MTLAAAHRVHIRNTHFPCTPRIASPSASATSWDERRRLGCKQRALPGLRQCQASCRVELARFLAVGPTMPSSEALTAVRALIDRGSARMRNRRMLAGGSVRTVGRPDPRGGLRGLYPLRVGPTLLGAVGGDSPALRRHRRLASPPGWRFPASPSRETALFLDRKLGHRRAAGHRAPPLRDARSPRPPSPCSTRRCARSPGCPSPRRSSTCVLPAAPGGWPCRSPR